MKNIVFLMAGGVGSRFGADRPKQYLDLNGRPVIDYVIDAIDGSKLTDGVIVYAGEEYIKYSDLLLSKINSKEFIFIETGKDRYTNFKNGFKYIEDNSLECERILIVDAVAPFITSDLIDDYFDKLIEYDAVITAQKITGALGNYNYDPLDREEYYMTQSPEGFRYPLISQYLNPGATTQELAWHLPKECTKYLNFNFKNNLKLTYDFELEYAKGLMKAIKEEKIKIKR